MDDLISRQAAIDGIAKLLAYHGSEGAWIDQKEALDVLKSLSSAQPEPCEDAVSRRAATAECFQSMVVLSSEFGNELPDGEKRFNDGLRKAIEKIRELPSVTPKRKMGKWVYKPNEYDDSTYECSQCGEPWTLIDGTPEEYNMKFCPNCGAKMNGGEQE